VAVVEVVVRLLTLSVQVAEAVVLSQELLLARLSLLTVSQLELVAQQVRHRYLELVELAALPQDFYFPH
jgi:hypothetical protein